MARYFVAAIVLALCAATTAGAGQAAPSPAAKQPVADPLASEPDYLLGPEDVLSIVFWRDTEMSAEVMVRPDGKISLPLLNDVQAAGLTPEQLRQRLMEAASKYIEQPNASVVVKTVNSRKVFITGMVAKPGTFPLVGKMNVVQLIAQAGGLQEYADSKNILIVRTEGGKSTSFKFNFKDFVSQRNMAQNIGLRPGDTVVVP